MGSIPEAQLDKLAAMPVSPAPAQTTAPTNQQVVAPSFTARIIEAYDIARVYAAQIEDPEYKQNVEEKLTRSNVRGSSVVGIRTPEDVVEMLASVSGWKEVNANLADDQIVVIQGTLAAKYGAFAAYASVREIYHEFGSPGLGSIQAKVGYQHPDDYYFCTMMRFPTNVITVQLKTDGGVEHLHQWFAGHELTSRIHMNDGDTIVRCGVVIPRVSEQKNRNHGQGNHGQNRRPQRPR